MTKDIKTLTTSELISQQALEISRLNYVLGYTQDEVTEIYHPEFGAIWRYISMINELSKTITALAKEFKMKCKHVDTYEPTCIHCRATKAVSDAANCVRVVSINSKERTNDATPNTNP